MRRLRYNVAMSLDGFIAGPKGEYDWIVQDPSIDFAALFREFDTAVMGRKTFELVLTQHADGVMPGLKTVVCTRTLKAADYPAVTIVNGDAAAAVAGLKTTAGKDIWLFGGGAMFRSLLDGGQVDRVEVALIPLILGGGIPFVPPGSRTRPFRLNECRPLPSGIVLLSYDLSAQSSE